MISKIRNHFLDHFGKNGSSRRVVEVNQATLIHCQVHPLAIILFHYNQASLSITFHVDRDVSKTKFFDHLVSFSKLSDIK